MEEWRNCIEETIPTMEERLYIKTDLLFHKWKKIVSMAVINHALLWKNDY
jgi:hypothetical protein